MTVDERDPQQGEFSASGTPAWVTGLQTSLRTSDPVFTAAYTPYWQMIGETLAKYQITNGGPVIAVQMENGEYSQLEVPLKDDLSRILSRWLSFRRS